MYLTWIEIDKSALANNISELEKFLKGTSILAMVKDNAYGHGLVGVAKEIEKHRVKMFGVVTLQEAMELRESGIKLPILILTPGFPEHAKEIVKNNINHAICTADMAEALSKEALKQGRKVNIHLKLDTGMGRLGITVNELVSFINKISAFKGLAIEGVFTHLATADSADSKFVQYQIQNFNKAVEILHKNDIYPPLMHMASTAGLIKYPNSHGTMVRPGISIYGIYPSPLVPHKLSLKPVMTIKTRVIFIKTAPKGTSLGYGRTYFTKRKTQIATLGIGYFHGFSRAFSNAGEVLIRGKKFPVRGRVCIDQAIVEVDIPNLKIGEEAVVIGKQGKEKITMEEISREINTIPYEIMGRMNSSIPRIFV